MSFVYFISYDGGPVKIGKAINPDRRIKKLQTGCPFELKILGVVSSKKYSEANMHQKFREYRMRGEWFFQHGLLLSWIKEFSVPFDQTTEMAIDESEEFDRDVSDREAQQIHELSKEIIFQVRKITNAKSGCAIKLGIERARASGKVWGRPGWVDREKIFELRGKNLSIRSIARLAGCSSAAVHKVLSNVS